MSRTVMALLFIFYFLALTIYSVNVAIRDGFTEPAEMFVVALASALLAYIMSGIIPFAVWDARGFRAARGKSLFIHGRFLRS